MWSRLSLASILVCCLALAGCRPTGDRGSEGEGEPADDDADDGDGDGDDGDGDGDGEGEGVVDPPASPLRVLIDGVAFEGDGGAAVDFGTVAASLLGQGGGASERRITLLPVDPSEPVELRTEPPILVAGLDAEAFGVVDQPAARVRPGGSSFAVRFAPTAVGPQRGALVFATGTRATERVIVPLAGIGDGPERVAGVRCAVYSGNFDALPDFAALTPVETTGAANLSLPAERSGTDFFAVVLLGVVEVPATGDWQFFSTSDDGSRVIVDGVVVVDNDGLHGPVEQSGTIVLAAGPHAIEVQFFEKTGGELLVVEWSGPGQPRVTVPATALFSTP